MSKADVRRSVGVMKRAAVDDVVHWKWKRDEHAAPIALCRAAKELRAPSSIILKPVLKRDRAGSRAVMFDECETCKVIGGQLLAEGE
jgi:hypothetical protein